MINIYYNNILTYYLIINKLYDILFVNEDHIKIFL